MVTRSVGSQNRWAGVSFAAGLPALSLLTSAEALAHSLLFATLLTVANGSGGGVSQTLRWGQPWLLLPPLTTTCLALAVTAGVRGSILFPMGWFSFSLFQDEDLKIFHSIIGYPISHANQPMLSLWEVGGRPQTWNHTSFALPLKNQDFGGRERRSKTWF